MFFANHPLYPKNEKTYPWHRYSLNLQGTFICLGCRRPALWDGHVGHHHATLRIQAIFGIQNLEDPGAEWLEKIKSWWYFLTSLIKPCAITAIAKVDFSLLSFLLLQLSDARHVDLDWGMRWVKVMPPRLCCRHGWSEMGMVLDLWQCVSWI